MRLPRAAWPAFASSCLLAFCASACGSSKGSNVNADGSTGASTGTGASTATGATGTGASGGGPNLGNLGGDTSASGGQSSVDNQCAGTLVEAQRIPLDMYVMLDVSGSMLEATAGDATVTKWQAVSSALSDFVSDPASDGMGMGMQVFPIRDPKAPATCTTNAQCADFGGCFLKTCWNFDGLIPCNTALDCFQFGGGQCVAFGQCTGNMDFVCNKPGGPCGVDADTGKDLGDCVAQPAACVASADCRPATYEAPVAAIAELPGAKAALVKAIQTAMPDPNGLTPTGPALQGAVNQASTWAMAHMDHQVVAVLATDGLPTLCDPVAIADVAAIAAGGRKLNPAISTFVIGVVGPADVDAPANLNSIAKSGGTTKAFIVDTTGNVQTQFRDALNKIRATGLSCELAVPTAEAGKTVDYGEVNVAFDSGMGPVDLESVPSVADCATHPQAWYYNVDPAQGTPTRIEACPGICSDFEKTDMGSVKIELGCKTRVVVK